jgi:hypothetical protein
MQIEPIDCPEEEEKTAWREEASSFISVMEARLDWRVE